jgi:hypothetical protein
MKVERLRSFAGAVSCVLVAFVGAPTMAARNYDHFWSERGGFEIKVPKGWYVLEEIDASGTYRAKITETERENLDDDLTDGISVLRIADYENLFDFEQAAPDAVALEYAQTLAASLARGSGAAVKPFPPFRHGAWIHAFLIAYGESSEDVTACLVLVGIRKKDFIRLVWQMSFEDFNSLIYEARRVLESFIVRKSWENGGP